MIQPGERLWNGAIVTTELAAAYNAISAKIAGFEAAGRLAPEELLNGRHNLIAGAQPVILKLWAWRHSVAYGWQWIAERDCSEATAADWLATYQADEPGVRFTVSLRKPRPC